MVFDAFAVEWGVGGLGRGRGLQRFRCLLVGVGNRVVVGVASSVDVWLGRIAMSAVFFS